MMTTRSSLVGMTLSILSVICETKFNDDRGCSNDAALTSSIERKHLTASKIAIEVENSLAFSKLCSALAYFSLQAEISIKPQKKRQCQLSRLTLLNAFAMLVIATV